MIKRSWLMPPQFFFKQIYNIACRGLKIMHIQQQHPPYFLWINCTETFFLTFWIIITSNQSNGNISTTPLTLNKKKIKNNFCLLHQMTQMRSSWKKPTFPSAQISLDTENSSMTAWDRRVEGYIILRDLDLYLTKLARDFLLLASNHKDDSVL